MKFFVHELMKTNKCGWFVMKSWIYIYIKNQQKLLFSQIGSMFIDLAARKFSNIEGQSATQRESISKKHDIIHRLNGLYQTSHSKTV